MSVHPDRVALFDPERVELLLDAGPDDELLELVDGGVIVENWQNRVAGKIAYYKNQYGDQGKDKLLALASGLFDNSLANQTSNTGKLADKDKKLALADKKSILSFIDENWDNI